MIPKKASESMNTKARSEYFLKKLVSIPSVSGEEQAVVAVCRELMTEIGLTTRLRPCAGVAGAVNLEGSLGSSRPKLCITGHLDTVPVNDMTVNPLGELQGNRYYGRGTTDMKGGLAAALAAIDRLAQAGVKLRGELVVVATASEETLKCGGYQLARDHHDADGVVCAEPTDCRVAIAATGSLPLRLDVHGASAHSSVPGGGGNAILAAYVVTKAIVDALSETIEVPFIGARRRAVNVGVIRGGIAQPVTPEHCTVWLDVRYFVGETAQALMMRINKICESAAADLPGIIRIDASQERLDYEGHPYPPGSWGNFIHVERGMKAFATDPTAAIVRSFRHAVREEGGNDDVDMMRGWGDVEFVATDHNVPTIYFGPGTVTVAHAANEYIDLDLYHMAIRTYERAIQHFLGNAITQTTR
jgi:acetylornithine deacetylase/succinyl-diaminopimelate desuccinylase-like protein